MLLILMSYLISVKCCRKNISPVRKNQEKIKNHTECLDLIEWNSNKPIQTSSPLPQPRHSRSYSRGLDANNNNAGNATNVGAKSTQPSLLGNIPRNMITPSAVLQQNQREIRRPTNESHKTSVLESASSINTVQRNSSPERNIFRNVRSFPMNETKNHVENGKNNNLIKFKAKSSSSVVNPENKRETTGFIGALKESPTEKKRQSIEKLRRSKVAASKSEEESEINDGNTTSSSINYLGKAVQQISSTNHDINIFNGHLSGNQRATDKTLQNQLPNSTKNSEKPLLNDSTNNSRLPPLPVRSNSSSRTNVNRENRNSSAVAPRRNTTHSSTPVLMQINNSPAVKMDRSHEGNSAKCSKSPNKITLIDLKSLSCEAFPLNTQQKRQSKNYNGIISGNAKQS
ncbi:hypothetical protein HELRODRAFT_159410 [Helobdella robusta]|uniref:Uncharacterized protein n=1 Tax=Helobdella robusta TaxID=6412 RepID=T1EP05_HELRO|nr:hypothetical protein HELRODRAFT_159410 [Helobdella robusta]ESO12823.1 hypothetical protein HELRODRAFT_159410 [Helobdella robusta]